MANLDWLWGRGLRRWAAWAMVVATGAAAMRGFPEAPYLFMAPLTLAAGTLGGMIPAAVAAAVGMAVRLMGGGDGGAWEVVSYLLIAVVGGASGEVARQGRVRAAQVRTDLQGREAHLASILDTVPDAMIVIDKAGIIESFSRTAVRLFGYEPAEVIGRNVSMLMPNPYRDEHDATCAPASGGSSGWGDWWSPSARTARPFPSSCRLGRWPRRAGGSSSASSAT
jgi:PAS domain-containing protein